MLRETSTNRELDVVVIVYEVIGWAFDEMMFMTWQAGCGKESL